MSECKLKKCSYFFLFWGESSYFFPIFQHFHSYFPIFCKSFGTWHPASGKYPNVFHYSPPLRGIIVKYFTHSQNVYPMKYNPESPRVQRVLRYSSYPIRNCAFHLHKTVIFRGIVQLAHHSRHTLRPKPRISSTKPENLIRPAIYCPTIPTFAWCDSTSSTNNTTISSKCGMEFRRHRRFDVGLAPQPLDGNYVDENHTKNWLFCSLPYRCCEARLPIPALFPL